MTTMNVKDATGSTVAVEKPLAPGQATAANSRPVVLASDAALPAGTNLLGKVKTKFIEAVAATMTRPADTNAYTANDAVANNTTAGSVTALSFSVSDVNDDTITLERLRLITSDTGAQGKNFRVWLYQVAVTPGAGDNAAFTAPRGSFNFN